MQKKLSVISALILALGVISAFAIQVFLWAHSDIYQHIEQYEEDWSEELEARRARNYCRLNPERC
tara:strand:- start:1048 stop:1242 length:195 start_codon:yes stop_codon:yes gene_type:complete